MSIDTGHMEPATVQGFRHHRIAPRRHVPAPKDGL